MGDFAEVNKMLRNKQIALILIAIALAIGVQQYMFYGVFFSQADLPIHHETFMVLFTFTGAFLLVLWWIRKNHWEAKS